ncbi:P2Y purinoceptor 1-like [Alosa sapidissima]|uniref:P2Y purinoceptor 1-like n=1 Tax=Alosa sapidissima TaxID=34773 RepID=UPI001C0819C1|nr:P2Y purinoceptor 1-like [Alosa sapidissima]
MNSKVDEQRDYRTVYSLLLVCNTVRAKREEKMDNTSECENVDKGFTHIFLPTIYLLVCVIGIVANVCGLKLVFNRWRTLGDIKYFILNLGIADLLYVSTLPFLVGYYAADSAWMFGTVFCKITRFCFHLNLYGSIGFLTCICVYRYLGIVYPMKSKGIVNTRLSVAISALVWTLVVIQILPDMFFEKTEFNSTPSCFDTTGKTLIKDYLPYSIGWTITGFVIPLLVIIVCYGHVAFVLMTKANINTLLKQRSLKLVIFLTVLFSVCFLPYHILRNLNLSTRILKMDGICYKTFDDIYIAYQVSRGLACLNSAINPLIYLVGNDDFLMRFHSLSKRTRRSLAQLGNAVIYRKPREMDSTVNTEAEPNTVTLLSP